MIDRQDQDGWLELTVDDELLLADARVIDTECIAVESVEDLRRLCADILGRRKLPVVAFALDLDDGRPMLTFSDVRAAVGPGIRIYSISCEDLLYGLREMLGPELAIQRGMARIWWPIAGARFDSADHPAMPLLEGEPHHVTVEELAQQFDLSRPRVRAQIRLIEDARAFLECELARSTEQSHHVHERLRDAQIECHALRARAEAAEASLAATRRPPHPEGH